ncbi:MAG: 3'(2'),5'-bisphosphate nucleotidase CysQ [Ectothiorhodospiraceae bacterium]|nr:3'(2'),5'-bisphosphate nucleotidase CysQ [Ectothiorhodospiraceae bacterium]MCH8503069.1 3'(2'),5'-bisphosphate nucleotidase CysQ [Ectothiorhodospiraceae bacterium]
MDANRRRELLPDLLHLARQAGDAIRDIYRQNFSVRRKADDSPLTDADQAAHDIISRGLAGLLPDTPLLSEESEIPSWFERSRWTRYWLVDPLDGTREFIRRNDQFSVNIALVENGTPVLGVVHAPISGLFWYGGAGIGGWRRLQEHEPVPIHPRSPLLSPMRVVLGRPQPGPRTRALLARLPPHEVLSLGASLKFCLVAEGGADLFPRYGAISEWDIAASQAILEAVGGRLVHLRSLEPVRYNTRPSPTLKDVLAVGDPAVDWRRMLGET